MKGKSDGVGCAWSKDLQCFFEGWDVPNIPRALFLYLPPNNACDMGGTIKVAKAILPSVRRIIVFQGDKPDIAYIKRKGRWKAYDASAIAAVGADHPGAVH